MKELAIWIVVAGAVGGVIYLDPLHTSKRRAPVIAIDAAVRVDAITPVDAQLPDAVIPDAPPAASPLYTVPEALDDIASSPLRFVGTGPWFSNDSIHACSYRNDRVIVVYEYCTVTEQPAFGMIVIAPTRGQLQFYVEADAPISTLTRVDYPAFRVESLAIDLDPAIALDATFASVDAWSKRQHDEDHGGCWWGDSQGCSKGHESQLPAWMPSAKEFLATPPQSFYALVKDLHVRAVHDLRHAK